MSYPMYPSGPQGGFVDPAGYPINPSYGDYPPPAYGYGAPSYPPGCVGTGYGSMDPYSAGPPAGAYSAVSREAAPVAPSLYGDHSLEELYSHGQQYGMTSGEVDQALKQYQELSEKQQSGELGETTDRGLLGDMILNFRLPSIMEFLTLIGGNRMQYVPVAPGPAMPMYPPPPVYPPYGYPYPASKHKAKEDPTTPTE